MDELLVEFLTETSESLAVLDVELVQFERDPHTPGLLSNVFRLVHTIKGTCGFLGLPRLEKVAHAGENVLGRFRDGDLEVTPRAISLVLRAIDTIKSILAALETSGSEPEGDDGALIAALNAVASGEAPEPVAEPVAVAAPVPTPRKKRTAKAKASTEIAAPPATLDLTPTASTEIAPADMATEIATTEHAAAQPGLISNDTGVREGGIANQSIRVTVDLLESLMTTVSELVLTRNQLLQIARSQKETDFSVPLQRLNQVVSELQDGVMKTRMQPIGNAWAKLPRIIRDLSHELGKKIELEMLGAETELDRQVLELVKDPLTHMVRNSADHGIEMPEERLRNGKREAGRILLNAFHQGGHIIIEIADDGRGLDIGRIKAKALANRLATEQELAGLSDAQIHQFIFRAGFSTAEKVTSVSGRGVGMDVVRTNIEKIGGTIELKSSAGAGSIFTIKIPLTLAIVSALIVEVAGERYAVPQTSVVELVRATESGRSEHRIERVKETPVLRLRDKLLPLVAMSDLLKLEQPEGTKTDERFVIVTQVGSHAFGMLVDRVFDTEEIVVKPVAPIMRHVPIFSGNTILGDGSVIMILDPNGVAASIGEVADHAEAGHAEAKQAAVDGPALTTLLVFRAGGKGLKAVPLSLIARLEEFERDQIEIANGQRVIQYRGTLMPLVAFDGAEEATDNGKRQPALVFAENERAMGLLVDEIIDIVETPLDIRLESDTPGVLGSAIVAGRATDLVDAGFYLKRAYANWYETPSQLLLENDIGKRVLVVDDSAFFRNLLAPLLQVAGYDVTTAQSGQDALALRDLGRRFDIIISDLEMPGMSGFDFATAVKADERWRETPVVALTAHAQPADVERALMSGFDGFVVKFDRSALLNKLSEALSDTRRAA